MTDMRYSAGGSLGLTPEEVRRANEAVQRNALARHEDVMRGFSMSLHGAAAREEYMRDHRLRYEVGGRLVQAPPLAPPPQDGPHGAKPELGTIEAQAILKEQAMGVGIAQMARAPGKMFSRSDILAILRAEYARYRSGLRIPNHPDCPSEAAVVHGLINVFENLE